MKNSIRKVLLAGVGAALITKEKAAETLNEFVREGRLNAKDAKAAARQLARDGRREFESVRGSVEDRLLDLAKQAGAQAQARIAALEQRVAELQKEKAAARPIRRSPRAKVKRQGT